MKKVLILVQGGVAYTEVCPADVEVEIVDLDNEPDTDLEAIRAKALEES